MWAVLPRFPYETKENALLIALKNVFGMFSSPVFLEAI
jgi:hypothetical protein